MSQMTKRALVASLKDLLAEKPLDKITVTDLTEHCGVNRMTFYYHFKDIYDLVEWACIENATRALAGQKDLRHLAAGLFADFAGRAAGQGVFYECLPLDQPRAYRELPLPRDLRSDDRRGGGEGCRHDGARGGQGVHRRFYKYAFVGLTLEWVRTGMKEDPAALVERVSTDPWGHHQSLNACRIDK